MHKSYFMCVCNNDIGATGNNGSRIKCSLRDNVELEKGCCPNQPLGHGALKFKNKGLVQKISNTHTEDTTRSESIGMGFKEHYVSVSLTKSNQLSTSLDWLMFHVPENQLPFVSYKQTLDKVPQSKLMPNFIYQIQASLLSS